MSKERLDLLENAVKAELYKMAAFERLIHGHSHDPITDGVIDIDRYLSSSPKMLWILKEPWDDVKDGKTSGGWSVTQLVEDKIDDGQIGNKGLYARMAYVTYSVFNDYAGWKDIDWVTDDPMVGETLRSIAYVNVSKFPGTTRSDPAKIAIAYERHRSILLKQIDIINADVMIFGNVLHLFIDDLGIKSDELKSEGSVESCIKDGRLYINAYHPSYWSISGEKYVDDIVAVIKKNRQDSEPLR